MNVLVVDDSVTMRKIVALALGKHDVVVTEAEDGRAALDIVLKEKIDLMILDINMPVLGGMDFLAELGKTPLAGKIPVIMLSTQNEKSMQDRALALGAKGFLGKPFQKPELQELVKKLTGVSVG